MELLVGDTLASFLLAPLQVGLGQLVHQLVEIGGRAHRHLQQLQLQDLGGALAYQRLLERVFDLAASEHLGRVVAGALLPVAPGQAVDEAALGVTLRFTGARIRNDLIGLVGLELLFGHEVTHL
ncbi:MAG: hypothetical protein ACKOCM_10645, partial [Cyanobacteriota bacterium]